MPILCYLSISYTPVNIASPSRSEASDIGAINNISSDTTIPPNKMIITLSKETIHVIFLQKRFYQGLSTCPAMISQNYYDGEDIPVGAELLVPIRSACPSENQIANGVISLMSYIQQREIPLVKWESYMPTKHNGSKQYFSKFNC